MSCSELEACPAGERCVRTMCLCFHVCMYMHMYVCMHVSTSDGCAHELLESGVFGIAGE
jgi:hypothetical protein